MWQLAYSHPSYIVPSWQYVNFKLLTENINEYSAFTYLRLDVIIIS